MKNFFLVWSTCYFFVLVLTNFSVATEKPESDKKIVIIENPLIPVTSENNLKGKVQVSLKKTLTIDTQQFDKFPISFIISIESDSHGSIYILDKKLNMIVKFDSNGRFLKTIGQKGQGPGEFSAPRNLHINEQDQLTVFDRTNRKFLFLKNDGTLIKEMKLHFDAIEGVCLNNGNFLFRENVLDRETGKFENILSIYNRDFKKIKEIGRIELPNRYAKKIEGIPYNLPWAVYKNRIISAIPQKGYKIYIYTTDGELEKVIKKEYRKIPPSQTYKEKFLEPLKRNPRTYSFIKDRLYFPDYLPPFNYLLVDETGNIFVQTYETDTDTSHFIFDVFNKEGKLSSRILIKDLGLLDTLLGKFRNNHFYCVHTNDMGEPFIVVYKVEWK